MYFCANLSSEAKVLKYFSNVFGMIGVAMVATAFFDKNAWMPGFLAGSWFILLGAFLEALRKWREEKND